MAFSKGKKNEITIVCDTLGILVDSYSSIPRVFQSFYIDLFTFSKPLESDFMAACDGINRCLSNEMVEEISTFSVDEVTKALFDMCPTKALRPDCFHALFFQKNWDLVGHDVTHACLAVLNNGDFVKEFNYNHVAFSFQQENHNHVAMIPKVKNPENEGDFRPISLCSVVYKMIAKIANRLKTFLPEIIDRNQRAFALGRLIIDNVIAAFESLHSLHKRHCGKKKFYGS